MVSTQDLLKEYFEIPKEVDITLTVADGIIAVHYTDPSQGLYYVHKKASFIDYVTFVYNKTISLIHKELAN